MDKTNSPACGYIYQPNIPPWQAKGDFLFAYLISKINPFCSSRIDAQPYTRSARYVLPNFRFELKTAILPSLYNDHKNDEIAELILIPTTRQRTIGDVTPPPQTPGSHQCGTPRQRVYQEKTSSRAPGSHR